MKFYFFIYLFLLLFSVSCTDSSSKKKMQLLIDNSSNLDVSKLERFSCKDYLSYEIYNSPTRDVNSFDTDVIFVKQHSDEQRLCKLTITPKNIDSLRINVEIFRIFHSDTLRTANFGGKTITLVDYEKQIKNIMCRFLNK